MKAIILSAGQGSRLGHLTDDKPKCLIDFNGRTLLDRQLDALAANGVDEAVVVTGFRDDQIEASLARRAGGPKVRTVYNPFYKVADNLGSLFVAKDEIDGDCLVWNGDTLVSDALMARVLGNDRSGICVTIDRKDAYDDDDMKVVVDGEGRLHAIGKRLPQGNINAEVDRAAGVPRRRRGALPRGDRAGDPHRRGHHHLVSARDPPHRPEGRRVDARHPGRAMGRSRFPRGRRGRRALVKGWDAKKAAAAA